MFTHEFSRMYAASSAEETDVGDADEAGVDVGAWDGDAEGVGAVSSCFSCVSVASGVTATCFRNGRRSVVKDRIPITITNTKAAITNGTALRFFAGVVVDVGFWVGRAFSVCSSSGKKGLGIVAIIAV